MESIFQDAVKFYAVFVHSQEDLSDESVWIFFPDLKGAFSQGDNVADGVRMAKECLALYVLSLYEDELPVPTPSDRDEIRLEENQTLHLIETRISDFYPDDLKRLMKKTSDAR